MPHVIKSKKENWKKKISKAFFIKRFVWLMSWNIFVDQTSAYLRYRVFQKRFKINFKFLTNFTLLKKNSTKAISIFIVS